MPNPRAINPSEPRAAGLSEDGEATPGNAGSPSSHLQDFARQLAAAIGYDSGYVITLSGWLANNIVLEASQIGKARAIAKLAVQACDDRHEITKAEARRMIAALAGVDEKELT